MDPESICMSYDRSIIWVRWAALWLDIIVRAAVIALMLLLSGAASLPLSISLAILFYIVYYPILEGLTGQTFGKWVCRLKVVDADGNRPGVLKATIRTLLRLVEINAFLFGGIPAGIAVASSPKRQRLGDMAANTFVVKSADLAALPLGPEAWRSAYDLEGPYSRAATSRPVKKSLGLKAWAMVLILPGLSLLYSGFEGKQAETASRHPITMTCAQFLRSPGKPGWYHLTNCSMDLSKAVYTTFAYNSDTSETSKNTRNDVTITDVYIPIFADEQQKKASLVIATSDARYKDVVDGLRKIGEKDEASIRKWILLNRDRIFVEGDITGTVKEAHSFSEISSLEMDSEPHFQVPAKFSILTDGEAPYQGFPDSALAVGAVFTLAAGLFWIGPWRRSV